MSASPRRNAFVRRKMIPITARIGSLSICYLILIIWGKAGGQEIQTSFTCPRAGQTPVVSQQGNNVLCNIPNQRDVCPSNALCLSSANSAGMYICCYSSPSTISPICPNNGAPQQGSAGCDITLNNCDFGYKCVRAENDFSTTMCCTNVQQPKCPNQQTTLMENGRPHYCNPSLSTSCPSGYVCTAAVATDGTFICCSSPRVATCPPNYSPNLDNVGNQINCSPLNPNECPGGSSCLQSPGNQALFICCRPNIAPRVCPNDQNALITSNGNLEICSGPGSTCSSNGYTCQLSMILAQWVCCGFDREIMKCADGRETFEQTYSCNPLQYPNECPIGYECFLSNVVGKSVCCRANTNPSSASQCPSGWNPYRNEVTGEHRTCTSPMDMSCPTGYSCTPISNVRFVCCRLATSIRCTRGNSLILNGSPRLCVQSKLNQCPNGYSCEQSTVPSITICCSFRAREEGILCKDRSPPGETILYCPNINSPIGCPSLHSCKMSNKGVNICCRDWSTISTRRFWDKLDNSDENI